MEHSQRNQSTQKAVGKLGIWAARATNSSLTLPRRPGRSRLNLFTSTGCMTACSMQHHVARRRPQVSPRPAVPAVVEADPWQWWRSFREFNQCRGCVIAYLSLGGGRDKKSTNVIVGITNNDSDCPFFDCWKRQKRPESSSIFLWRLAVYWYTVDFLENAHQKAEGSDSFSLLELDSNLDGYGGRARRWVVGE